MALLDDDADELGLLVDRLSNALAANELPMSDSLKITGMTGIVREVRNALRDFVVERSDYNPWEDHPDD